MGKRRGRCVCACARVRRPPPPVIIITPRTSSPTTLARPAGTPGARPCTPAFPHYFVSNTPFHITTPAPHHAHPRTLLPTGAPTDLHPAPRRCTPPHRCTPPTSYTLEEQQKFPLPVQDDFFEGAEACLRGDPEWQAQAQFVEELEKRLRDGDERVARVRSDIVPKVGQNASAYVASLSFFFFFFLFLFLFFFCVACCCCCCCCCYCCYCCCCCCLSLRGHHSNSSAAHERAE